MTTTRLAKDMGLTILSTSRNPNKINKLKANGVDHVIIDDGDVVGQVRELYPDGVDRVLELIGTTTLLNSLRTAKRGGIVCMTGILGGAWTLANFTPMEDIPTGVKLTCYAGEAIPPPSRKSWHVPVRPPAGIAYRGAEAQHKPRPSGPAPPPCPAASP